MSVTHGYFSSLRGTAKLYYKVHHSHKNSDITLICLHNFLYHGGSYNLFVDHLFKESSFKFTLGHYDFKGHGLSSGRRAYIENFEELVLDLMKFINFKVFSSNSKIILMGVGLGGSIILNYLSHYYYLIKKEIAGIILINPLLEWKRSHLKIFGKIKNLSKIGHLRYPTNFTGHDFTNDFRLAELFNADPLIPFSLTNSLMYQISLGMKQIKNQSYLIDIPSLICSSGNDSIADYSCLDKFVMGMDKKKLTLKFFRNSYHDIINCRERGELFNEISIWLNKLCEKNGK